MSDLKDSMILASNMRKRAYSPYSNYTVGAVLKCKNGKKYTGCNVENGGIQSICAERVAFCKAISEGEYEFESIVIIGGKKDKEPEKCLPCGYCRQFMSEFVGNDFKIYTIYDNKVEEYIMEDLLPNSFELKNN
jgi:cytidine deaminase